MRAEKSRLLLGLSLSGDQSSSSWNYLGIYPEPPHDTKRCSYHPYHSGSSDGFRRSVPGTRDKDQISFSAPTASVTCGELKMLTRSKLTLSSTAGTWDATSEGGCRAQEKRVGLRVRGLDSQVWILHHSHTRQIAQTSWTSFFLIRKLESAVLALCGCCEQ